MPIIDLDDLYARPGFLLRRAHQIAVGIFVQECASFRLTPPQHSALIVLASRSGMDQATLARTIGFDRATTGKVVEGLEGRGLLRREASPTDKRRNILMLTVQGRALLKRATPAIERTSELLLAPLKAAERARFIELLDQLTDRLNDASRSPVIRPARNEAVARVSPALANAARKPEKKPGREKRAENNANRAAAKEA